MSTDRYTQFILTVIALCLTVLAADKVYDSLVPEAQAAYPNTIKCRFVVGGEVKTYSCTPVAKGHPPA